MPATLGSPASGTPAINANSNGKAQSANRLTVDPGGERKIFRDSAVTNLTEFFQRFKSLNIRSNVDLDGLVTTAQEVLQGTDPHAVRSSDSLRAQITAQLSGVQAQLDQMLVDGPRRRILRNQPATHVTEG